MQEKTTERTPFGRNLKRWAGGLTGAGAIALVAIMALGPASAAASANLVVHGGTAVGSYDLYHNGCATGKTAKPGFNVATGAGHVSMSDAAKTCKAAKGGLGLTSDASSYAEIGKDVALKTPAAYSSANITWSIKGTAADSAVGTLTHCPVNYYSYTTTVGNTTGTVMFTEQYSFCASEASWSLSSYPEVYDMTTKTYSSGYWSVYNTTGTYYDHFYYTYNYSNPALGTNSTYNYTYNHNYGSHNSTAFNQMVSVVLSGSWAKGDRLLIYATLDADTYTEVQYATHGKAAAMINAAGTAGHLDLVGITLS